VTGSDIFPKKIERMTFIFYREFDLRVVKNTYPLNN